MKSVTLSWLLVIALATAGCHAAQPASWDERASAEYLAAWQKKAGGDEAGYRAALRQVAARYPDTRAGRRARSALAPSDGVGFAAAAVMGVLMIGLASFGGAGYLLSSKKQ